MSGSAQAYDAHDPILILDNASLISFGFPGEGTEENPFLIQNYEIDGACGSAISIHYTDLHVKIRNCLLSNSSWPSAVIQLEYVKNVTIENNRLVDSYVGVGLFRSNNIVIRNNTFQNHDTGIVLENSDRNFLINNTCVLDIADPSGKVGIKMMSSNNNSLEMNNCSGNNDGIYLTSSHFNTLSANICNDNDGSGITIDSSLNNTMTENICRSNSIGGIYLSPGSSVTTGNRIDNNDCSGNGLTMDWGAGIFLYSSPTSTMSNNTISNNELSGNYYGIWVLNAPNNTIYSNTVHTSSATGIYLSSSSNNTVSSNDVFENVGFGIWLDSSCCCTVRSNTVWNNYIGINLDESHRNVLFNNDLPSNDYGIFIYSGSFNTISYNRCNSSIDGEGIYLYQSDSNGLFNNYCVGNGNSHGIFLGDSDQNTLLNNTCDDNYGSGIDICNSQDCLIANNTCNGNLNGVSIFSETSGASINNIIHNNTCSGNTNNGIYIQDQCSSTTVTNNTCNSNSMQGVEMINSQYCEIANNTCNGNFMGIWLHDESDDNNIRNNNCSENSNAAICLDNSYGCELSNNTCNGNAGIMLESSANSTITNNTCIGNYDGISVSNSPGALVAGNNCTGNYDGISVFQSSNCTIVRNVCDGNTYGILLSNDCDDNVLIENICGSNALHGITVGYSDRNLLLNNTCNLNVQHGIIVGSSYNVLINNTCHDNGGYGILLENAQHSLVQMNSCTGNAVGIRLQGSTNNTLEDNDCSYNNVPVGIRIGISLRESHWNTIANNSCLGNWQAGIRLERGSDNNTISGNALSGNGMYGMSLYSSDNNRIVNNILADNVGEGLFLNSSNLNSISGNVAVGNNGSTSEYDTDSIQAYDDGTNFWNATAQGNLWGDWTSPDANGDGIVDEPYLIGGGNSRDQLPLALGLVIASPVDGYATDASVIDLSGTTISYLGATQVSWSNAATGDSGICVGTDPWNATVPLAEGFNLITVTMTAPSGMFANDTVTVVRDNAPPTMIITSPAEGAYTGSSVTVTWTGSDAESGITYCLVSIEGVFYDNVTGNSCTIDGLSEGAYSVLVSAYDLVGNYLDVSVSFTVDVTAPVVTILTPADDSMSTSSSVTVTWNGSDVISGVDRYEVSWEGGSPPTLLPSAGSYIFTGLSDGSHVLTVVIYDKAGLSSTDSVTVLIDTQDPSLTITSPAQGSYLGSGDITVSWSGGDAGTGIAYYTASIEGGQFFNTTGTSCIFSDLADGTYTVLVSAYDQLGNNRDVPVTFTVDTEAPTLVITAPTEGWLFNTSSVTVTWTTSDANPGTVQVSVDSGAWVAANEARFLSTGLTSGAHKVYVKVTDAAGNFAERSANFTVDIDAPNVWFVSPAEGALVNSSAGTMEWEAEDATSILNSTLVRVDEGDWTELGAATGWIYSLEDGNHTIEVKVTDLAGNSASATLNLTVDSTAPTAERSPIGDELELDLVVLVEFSEAMNQTSVSIAVSGVTGTLAWQGNAATFTPSQLLYNTIYSITVSGKDLAGNLLEMNWTFSTRSVGNITGVVLDENGDPAANVTVVAGGEFTAVTDENGRFLFVNLSVGTYLFEVDADGYEPFSFNATVEKGITVDEGTVEMVPDEAVDEGDGDGGSIWLYVIIAIAVLAAVAVAFVLLRKK